MRRARVQPIDGRGYLGRTGYAPTQAPLLRRCAEHIDEWRRALARIVLEQLALELDDQTRSATRVALGALVRSSVPSWGHYI